MATDEANIRSGYAEVMTEVLLGNFDVEDVSGSTATYYLQKDGSVSTDNTADNLYKCQGAPSSDVEIAGQTVTKWSKNSTVTYNYENGKVVINKTA